MQNPVEILIACFSWKLMLILTWNFAKDIAQNNTFPPFLTDFCNCIDFYFVSSIKSIIYNFIVKVKSKLSYIVAQF
jgi:hypothetical protein